METKLPYSQGDKVLVEATVLGPLAGEPGFYDIQVAGFGECDSLLEVSGDILHATVQSEGVECSTCGEPAMPNSDHCVKCDAYLRGQRDAKQSSGVVPSCDKCGLDHSDAFPCAKPNRRHVSVKARSVRLEPGKPDGESFGRSSCEQARELTEDM